jgi:hypothetical protein
MPLQAKFVGLSPKFDDAFRQLLLTSSTVTDELTFKMVVENYDLDFLYEVILLKLSTTPFNKSDRCKSFLAYLSCLSHPFHCPKYFLSIAVPIYRERLLKIESEKRLEEEQLASKDNVEDLLNLERVKLVN